jgi:hypothetical protein
MCVSWFYDHSFLVFFGTETRDSACSLTGESITRKKNASSHKELKVGRAEMFMKLAAGYN